MPQLEYVLKGTLKGIPGQEYGADSQLHYQYLESWDKFGTVTLAIDAKMLWVASCLCLLGIVGLLHEGV